MGKPTTIPTRFPLINIDDLTKQNSLIYQNWKVYRWVYNQLKHHPEKVKDELRIFVGEIPAFQMLEDYLPKQKGKLIELREHQQAALASLQTMAGSGGKYRATLSCHRNRKNCDRSQ